MCLTKENLGMVKAKEGAGWATFYDLEQKEAAEAFNVFIKDFMTEVNTYRHMS